MLSCNSKKSRFSKKQEASGLLSSLGIKTPSQVSIIGPISFWGHKTKKIINRALLAGYKFMSEIYLWQPGLTYTAFGPFTKNKEGKQKAKETGDSRYIYQN